MNSLFPAFTRRIRVVRRPLDPDLERLAETLRDAGYNVEPPDEDVLILDGFGLVDGPGEIIEEQER